MDIASRFGTRAAMPPPALSSFMSQSFCQHNRGRIACHEEQTAGFVSLSGVRNKAFCCSCASNLSNQKLIRHLIQKNSTCGTKNGRFPRKAPSHKTRNKSTKRKLFLLKAKTKLTTETCVQNNNMKALL